MAADMEIDFPPHEFGFVDQHVPGVVGVKAEVMHGLQLHQRHPPAGGVVDNVDAERFARERGREGQHSEEKAADHAFILTHPR